jgi:hypothetical protein
MGETEDRAQALRLKLASRRDSRRRVPVELRQEAVAFAKAEHASGRRHDASAVHVVTSARTRLYSHLVNKMADCTLIWKQDADG